MNGILSVLPRELAPGVFWLGKCLGIEYEGTSLHLGHWCFLVVGEHCSALVDAGATNQSGIILEQLDGLLAGRPELKYVFVTHSEAAHSGAVGHVLARFPEATAHGDVSDLHLVFPRLADQLHFVVLGERFDLGGTEIVVVECVFRDLVASRWFFDTKRRVLFTGDGLAFGHFHTDAGCGRFVEEAPLVEITRQMQRYGVTAFHWTQYVRTQPLIDRIELLIFEQLGAEVIAPSHGLPIGDPATTMPKIRAGLTSMSLER